MKVTESNNEGALVFGYELEDIDTVGGADVYNGQQSVLWKNLREMFPDELRAMYQQLRSTGAISYDKVEQMFEDHQSKWSEAIFNEDAWFKYLAPLEEKNSAAYLSMLQGSKAEQRKWWLYNRFKYLDSKYNAGDSLTDVITLRGYAKSNITITPYADIYATVKYGSYLVQQRAERKQSYELICPLDNVNDTEIYIYSASQLADVGDLSGLKVGYAEFVYATKLQNLKLGDDAALYQNNNLQTLYLGQNTLLKTLDVRNCYALGTGDQKSVDLSGCTNIEEVYFDGTQVKGVTLPNGGILKKLHLPGTVTNITIRNQTSLTEFECDGFENVTTLWLENPPSVIDTSEIVAAMPTGGRVRLFNFHWELNDLDDVDELFDNLDTMSGLDQNGNNTAKAQVYGTIHVPTANGTAYAEIRARYPEVTITYDHIESTLSYYSYDGTTLLHTETVTDEGNGTWDGTPSKTADAQYSYTFAGWSRTAGGEASESALVHIVGDVSVYAAYTPVLRTYTVLFIRAAVDGGGTYLRLNNVPYGTVPTYTGSTPESTNDDGGIYEFAGWTPAIAAVTGNTTYTAAFNDVSIRITYMNGDTEIGFERVSEGEDGEGLSTTPTKASDVQWVYTFSGWNANSTATAADPNALKNVTESRTVYAMYTATAREYTITFVTATEDGGATLQTKQVAYGTVPTYTGSTPTSSRTDYVFAREWTPALTAVTGDATYTAVFMDASSILVKYLHGTIVNYVSGQGATEIGSYGLAYQYNLKTVETYATVINSGAFYEDTALEKIDMKHETGQIVFYGNLLSVESGAKLNSIIIRSSTTALLPNSGIPIQFETGHAAIYVPANKLTDYKTSSQWSKFADHIYPIDSYPVTNYDTIQDDLSTFCTKLANGTANYSVGDTKTIDLGDYGQIMFRVAGKNVDELASGGATANYTFIAQNFIDGQYRMNSTSSTEGGWADCELRATLASTVFDAFPSELQAVIKSVKKYSSTYENNAVVKDGCVTNDKLWIPCDREISDKNTRETLSPSYTGMFSSSDKRKMYRTDFGATSSWFIRSVSDSTHYEYVGTSGSISTNQSNNRSFIILGFCA